MQTISSLLLSAGFSALLGHPVGTTTHQPAQRHVLQAPAARFDMRSWQRMPYSGSVIVAHDMRLGLIHPAYYPYRNVIPLLSCKGPPCVLPNLQASEGGQPVNETPVVVNPKKTTEVISGGNDYNCPLVLGFYVSNDGGSTWAPSCHQTANGYSSGDGDPNLGYDLKGHVYRGGIEYGGPGYAIVQQSSKNNGKTWGTPYVAVTPYFSGGLTDKDWTQIDTNKGKGSNAIYVSVTQFDTSNDTQITVTHSTNGGKTWKTVAVGSQATYPNINQFTDLTIDNKGEVYVSWMACTANGSTGDCGGTVATMMISVSKDGGNTWSTPVSIHTVNLAPDPAGCCFYGALPGTGERVQDIPVIAVDNSKGGKVGTLYLFDYNYTGSFMQMQVTSSKDGGKTWSSEVDVNPTSTHDQFMQWIEISSNGTVGVSWMDRTNDPNNHDYEAFGSYSTDGGKTFATPLDLSASPSDPNNDGFGGGFFGDYTGNSWAGKALYVTYPDTSNGTNAQDYIAGFLLP